MKKLNLDEIQKLELEILIKFDEFCKNNSLNYFIAYGTLLGAMRHGGFIPWDDDIDVQMPRSDYEKFINLRSQFENKNTNLCIKIVGDKGYPFPFIKIENTKTVIREHKMTEKVKTGIWVDIFPLEDCNKPNKRTVLLYKRQERYMKIIQKALAKPGEVGANGIRRLLNYFIIPLSKFYVSITKLATRIDTMGQLSNKTICEYCGTIVWALYREKEIFKKSDIYPLSKKTFCGIDFYAPKDPDLYLKQIYGNYKQLPPENERETHLADAWEI